MNINFNLSRKQNSFFGRSLPNGVWIAEKRVQLEWNGRQQSITTKNYQTDWRTSEEKIPTMCSCILFFPAFDFQSFVFVHCCRHHRCNVAIAIVVVVFLFVNFVQMLLWLLLTTFSVRGVQMNSCYWMFISIVVVNFCSVSLACLVVNALSLALCIVIVVVAATPPPPTTPLRLRQFSRCNHHRYCCPLLLLLLLLLLISLLMMLASIVALAEMYISMQDAPLTIRFLVNVALLFFGKSKSFVSALQHNRIRSTSDAI